MSILERVSRPVYAACGRRALAATALASTSLVGAPGEALTTVPGTARPDAPQVTFLADGLWAKIRHARVQGDYAYCLQPNGLLVLDVSTPEHPGIVARLSSSELALLYGDDLVVRENHLFVAGNGGLRIVDVSDPASPRLRGSYAMEMAPSVEVSNDHAYIAAGEGLHVVDLSDLDHPTQVGYLAGAATYVKIQGRYAYVSTGVSWAGMYLRIVDIADPAAPVQVGEIRVGTYRMSVSGSRVYTLGLNDLNVVDVSEPSAPVIEGTYRVDGGPLTGLFVGLEAVGDHVFIAEVGETPGLRVVDVSDPAHPTLAGRCDVPGPTGRNGDVVVMDGSAWVAEDTGLHIVDVADPTAPSLIGTYGVPRGGYSRVVTSGGRAFVTSSGELLAVDIRNPAAPVLAGQVGPLFEDGAHLAVAGNQAYLASSSGLQIVDVSADVPVVMGRVVGHWGRQNDIDISGGYAYAAADPQGLRIIDVTDPQVPFVAAYWQTSPLLHGIAAQESHVYGVGPDGFVVLDVSDARAPELVGRLPDLRSGTAVEVKGHYAYAVGEEGLRTIDIADHTAPVEAGRCDAAGASITLQGPYAYVINGSLIQIVDISNPRRPTVAGTLTHGTGVTSLAVQGDHIVATEYDALVTFGIARNSRASAPRMASSSSGEGVPSQFALVGNDPNPFNPETSIRFELPRTSSVRIQVYDAQGRLIQQLVDGVLPPGRHGVWWRGRNEGGEGVASGTYFVTMEAQGTRVTKKITLLK